MPTYYPRMKELNARGAEAFDPIAGAAALSPSEVEALTAEQDVVVLDLRRPEAFGGAHIRGSINVGAGQNLSLWAGWLVDSKSRIVLVNDQGDDEDSRRGLVRVGLDNIVGFLKAGMSAWINAGLALSEPFNVLPRKFEIARRTSWCSMCAVKLSGMQVILRARRTSCSATCPISSKDFQRTARSSACAAADIDQASQQVCWPKLDCPAWKAWMAAWLRGTKESSPSKHRRDRERKETVDREHCREATHWSFSCADSMSGPPDQTCQLTRTGQCAFHWTVRFTTGAELPR